MKEFEQVVKQALDSMGDKTHASRDALLKEFATELKVVGAALPGEEEILAAIVTYLVAIIKLPWYLMWIKPWFPKVVSLVISLVFSKAFGNDWYTKLKKLFGV